ncbi:MAG: ATP-binding protein, partial [Spirochaetota bacterium]
IQEILNAAKRSSEITRKLLGFARKQPIEPQIIHLNTVIGDMFNMLRRLIGEEVTLRWNPGSDVWPITVDPVQIEQIVANLCLNARDAVAKDGNITLETGNADVEAEFCFQHGGEQPGRYTRMTVIDTGCGMDEQTKNQALDPFFTTKEVGKGSGLGLSTVYGIVKQNNGIIVIDSEPERGTRIDIYLPSSIESQDAAGGSLDENYLPLGHEERILLLEDEKALRDITTHMLERLGYRILPTSSPGEVLEQAHKGSLQFDLLLTDVIMPETNGKELKDQLSQICPPFETVFMSGYSTEIIAHQDIIREGIYFLQKPFTLQQLAKKVREALTTE